MRTSVVALVVVLASALPARAGAEEKALPRTPDEQVLEEFVRLVNGTWVLEQRVTRNGQRIDEPLTGTLQIELVRQSTRMVGARALGRFALQESRGAGGPTLEAEGLWEVRLDNATQAGSGAVFLVAQASSTRGTGGACERGVVSQSDMRVRLVRNHEKGAAPARLELVKPTAPAASRTFRGRVVPAEWVGPVSFENTALRAHDVRSCSRDYVDLRVTGNDMRITWQNGNQDSLKRTSTR